MLPPVVSTRHIISYSPTDFKTGVLPVYRREAFRRETGTKVNCRITIIAAEGIKPGLHSAVAQNTLTLDDLLAS